MKSVFVSLAVLVPNFAHAVTPPFKPYYDCMKAALGEKENLLFPVPGEKDAVYYLTPKNIIKLSCHKPDRVAFERQQKRQDDEEQNESLDMTVSYQDRYATSPDTTDLETAYTGFATKINVACLWDVEYHLLPWSGIPAPDPGRPPTLLPQTKLQVVFDSKNSKTLGKFGINNSAEVQHAMIEALKSRLQQAIHESDGQLKFSQTAAVTCGNIVELAPYLENHPSWFVPPKDGARSSTGHSTQGAKSKAAK